MRRLAGMFSVPAKKDKHLTRKLPLSSRSFTLTTMRRLKILAVSVLVAALTLEAQAARIIKVLPHLLDREGRHSRSPGLYERDAYQAFLRQHPEECSALRFDVQWKAKGSEQAQLKLRIEIRGSREARPLVLERPVRRNHWYHRWSSLTLEGESYRNAGDVLAWRATLWEGDKLIAEQKSFLW